MVLVVGIPVAPAIAKPLDWPINPSQIIDPSYFGRTVFAWNQSIDEPG
jgi:hypothetical protein